MKKIILLFVLSLYILGCNEKNEEKYILISGKISNPVSKEINLSKRGTDVIEKKITLDENGFFNDTIRSGSGLYSYSESKNIMSFYLVDGGKIHLTYDGNDAHSTVKVSGKYAETSNYLFTKMKLSDELRGDMSEF